MNQLMFRSKILSYTITRFINTICQAINFGGEIVVRDNRQG
jgi:hypothetical protein